MGEWNFTSNFSSSLQRGKVVYQNSPGMNLKRTRDRYSLYGNSVDRIFNKHGIILEGNWAQWNAQISENLLKRINPLSKRYIKRLIPKPIRPPLKKYYNKLKLFRLIPL